MGSTVVPGNGEKFSQQRQRPRKGARKVVEYRKAEGTVGAGERLMPHPALKDDEGSQEGLPVSSTGGSSAQRAGVGRRSLS